MIKAAMIFTSYEFNLFRLSKLRKESTKSNKKEHIQDIHKFLGVGLLPIAIFWLLFTGISVASATEYYVSLSGNNANAGTTLDTAWRTITYAATKAHAGDTVNILAGNYGKEYVVFSNSGNATHPIIIQGIKGFASINQTDGTDGTIGFNTNGKSFITLKNLSATYYNYGFQISGSDIVMDNLYSVNTGYYGIYLLGVERARLTNSTFEDASMNGIQGTRMHNSILHNITILGTKRVLIRDGIPKGMDYYLVISDSHNNTISDIIANNTASYDYNWHGGHAIGIKDTIPYNYPHSYNNTFYNLTIIRMAEPLLLSHGSYGNIIYNFTSDALNVARTYYGLTFRDGTHDNLVYDGVMVAKGSGYGIQFEDTGESPGTPWNENNTVRNVILTNHTTGVYIHYARNNNIQNNVIIGKSGAVYLFNALTENNNIFKNNIVTSHSSLYYGAAGSINIIYSDFWGNGFSTPSGTGNIGSNPIFVNSATGDFHLKSQYGRWTPTGWVYTDTQTSPVIDAGDPASDYSKEPSPNGGRINIGSDGNSPKASMSGGVSLPFDFSLSNSGDIAVNPGSSGFNTVTATLTSGATQSVTFSISGLPAGATATFSGGNFCSPTCSKTLAVSAASSTLVGTYPLIVTATNGSLTRITGFNLVILASVGEPIPFDFSLSNSGDIAVNPGSSGFNTVTATLTSGATQSVTFSISGLPAGATATFSGGNFCSPTCSKTLAVSAASSTLVGTYPLIVTATNGSLTRTIDFYLDVSVSDSLPSDLVAYWKLNDGTPGATASDSSGNGNTATINGANWTTQGRLGSALEFDGLDDYVEVSNDTSLNTKTLTLMAWLKPLKSNVLNPTLFMRETSTGDNLLIVRAGINSSNSSVGVSCEWPPQYWGASYNFQEDQWYHVATIINGTQRQVYVNGILIGENIAPNELNYSDPGKFFIGQDQDGANTSDFFKGTIDEVKIYNRALSEQEIKLEYDSGNSSNPIPSITTFSPSSLTPSVTQNTPTSFNVATDQPVSSAWYLNGANQNNNAQAWSHTWDTIGQYNMTYMGANGNGSVSIIWNVIVVPSAQSQPTVSNPSSSPSTIPDDTDSDPRWGETSRLNVTVTSSTNIASVTIDFSAIGGSPAQPMANIGGNTWSVTTNASAGTLPRIYDLKVNATDINGNSSASVGIPLTIVKNGDINGDGVVNIVDAMLLANYVTYPGQYSISSLAVADVTGDGSVNIVDAMYLANYVTFSGYILH